MRLINVNTLELETFNDERNIPRYAILSHRWVDGQEVLYKDLVKRRNEQLRGWWKIRLCCTQAATDGLGYAWVDTCCIDKNSSAELSEAINSMFRWYANAHICYSYLPDVTFNKNDHWEQEFTTSSWFTRSWTLQELLAPKSLEFYDRTWNKIGLRSALSEEIAEASGIHLSALTSDKIDLSEWSVAQRMSWASKRTATRVEDVAYSLLGIFDVNMPLLYGEGQKAFRRLQEEIIRQTYDHTVFAWSSADKRFPGLLASSPAAFKHDADVIQRDFQDAKAYSLTNLGLEIELPLEEWVPSIYWAGLNCTKNAYDQLGIWLLIDERQKGCYMRVHQYLADWEDDMALRRKHILMYLLPRQPRFLRCTQMTINIATRGSHSEPSHYSLQKVPTPLAGFYLSTLQVGLAPWSDSALRHGFSHTVIGSRAGRTNWETFVREARYSFNILCGPRKEEFASRPVLIRTYTSPGHPSSGLMCIVVMPIRGTNLFAIKLGFDRGFHPVCIISETSHPALRSPPASLSALFDFPDRFDSNDLSGKTFWQCNGLEQFGWQDTSSQVLPHQKHMQRGLWALRADRSGTSNFMLRMSGVGSDCLVNICFQKLETYENTYSFALRQQSESSQEMQRLTPQ